MGKAGRWLRSFLAAKKEKTQPEGAPVAALPAASPKEKKRWSFRLSVSPGKAAPSSEQSVGLSASEAQFDQKQHAVAVAVATAAAADAAVVAADAAAAVIRLTAAGANRPASLVEDAAAVRIQASFRGYLARKALCALRGLVKLQALVRGHLVRKQAEATLRCMQALVSAQSRLRAQQLRVLQERDQPPHRRSPHHPRHRRSYEMDRSGEENIKIVEVDSGAPARGRSSCSVVPAEPRDRRCYYGQCSPVPSALTELSPRACSGHFEEFSFATARSSPQYVSAACDAAAAEFFPNYMANTESSRAKARSQSAPRQRTDALERQPSRRKGGGAEPRKAAAKMQRSSSHVGATAAHGLHYPWSAVRLDRSSVSLKNSECGSTSSVLTTNTGYCRSVAGFELHRSQF